MKKFIALALAVMMVLALAACGTTETGTPTEEPKQSAAAPTENAAVTDAPATDAPEPTAEPTQAPTKEPKPTVSVEGLDAVITDFIRFDEDILTFSSATAYIKSGEPFVRIITEEGDNNVTVPFYNEDEELGFDAEEYPIIALKYRVGYGQTIRQTNHLYAVTVAGGPKGEAGWYEDIDYVLDADWHVAFFYAAEKFPEAGTEWRSLRMPTVDAVEGEFALAWIGAFKTEEDVNAYDAAFNEVYGDKLVKDEAPIGKKESVPDYEDSFDDTLMDFEEFSEGNLLTAASVLPYAKKQGANKSMFQEDENGNIVLKLQFDAFYYPDLVAPGTAYTATFDYRNGGNGDNFGGIVFDWGYERNEKFDFFENNGLATDGKGSLCGCSGAGISFLGGSKIKVYVIVADTEAGKVTFISTEIDTGIDLDSAMNHFVVKDNGTDTVEVYINDTLIFSVKYSDAGLLPDNIVAYKEQYYRNIKVLGADGTELMSSETALFSIYKSFAFGARAHDTWIDNVKITNG